MAIKVDKQEMVMKNTHFIITGATRGIGYGLAKAFLMLGHIVTICGRNALGVDKAVASLRPGQEADGIHGVVCDVRVPDLV